MPIAPSATVEPGNAVDLTVQLQLALQENAVLRQRLAERDSAQALLEKHLSFERLMLQTLVENCPLLLYAKDTQSRFLFGNSAVAKVMGTTPEQLLGKTDFDFHPPALAAQYFADEQAVLNSGESLIGKEEPVADQTTGKAGWSLTSKVLLKDAQGTVLGLLGIGFDVTERKLLEKQLSQAHEQLLEAGKRAISRLEERNEELERGNEEIDRKLTLERIVLRTLVETCPFRIYAKDTHSRFIFGNMEMAKAVGLASPEELNGKQDFDFFPHELATEYFNDEQALIASRQSLIGKYELTTAPDTNEEWWILTSKVLLKDPEGRTIGLVGIGFNVTETKRLERELVHRNAALAKLNEELSSTRERLVQSGKMAALGSLVAGVSHELNTPLGNCLMVASTIGDNTHELDNLYRTGMTRSKLEGLITQLNAGVEILVRNLQRAADLVLSFKQISVDQTTSQRRMFVLADTVDEILLTVTPMLRKAQVLVTVDVPRDIKMDSYPGPLGQILINLITNAILHGLDRRNDGHITIRAQATEHQLTLAVQDNGAGIPPENLPRVFDPFFTTKLGVGGSGLGLNVSHNIAIGLLAGSLEVHSNPGKGACFTLQVPMVTPVRAVQPD